MSPTNLAVAEWRGRNAVDVDGDKVGTILRDLRGRRDRRPEWLAVKTGHVRVEGELHPVRRGERFDGDVRLPYDKRQIKDAPSAEADGELSQKEEAGLYPPLRA